MVTSYSGNLYLHDTKPCRPHGFGLKGEILSHSIFSTKLFVTATTVFSPSPFCTAMFFSDFSDSDIFLRLLHFSPLPIDYFNPLRLVSIPLFHYLRLGISDPRIRPYPFYNFSFTNSLSRRSVFLVLCFQTFFQLCPRDDFSFLSSRHFFHSSLLSKISLSP